MTKRPLDIDREEETRKTETSKWLESHFGSESSARSSTEDSRDEDIVVEPTKKTFFSVTIKSSPTSPSPTPSPQLKESLSQAYTVSTKLTAPQKLLPLDKEREPTKKYFQGISEWSERQPPPAAKPLISKEFQEKLAGTLQRNRLARESKEDLRRVGNSFSERQTVFKTYNKEDDYAVPIKKVTPTRTQMVPDVKPIKSFRDEIEHLSSGRNDVRHKIDDIERPRKMNGYLTRQDSGYVRESKEDVRHSKERRDIVEELPVKSPSIQRDDSAYISSSTYFTTPRSPKRHRSPINRTPDSGIKSPSPPTPPTQFNGLSRPAVPERKRAMERKMNNLNERSPSPIRQEEPAPDYSPPPRSRSHSPLPNAQSQYLNGYGKKQYQKTRFSETVPRSNGKGPAPPPPIPPPVMPSTNNIEKDKKKVGATIGNSIRKLVGKIRSASAERKLKLKSNKNRSPSPQHKQVQQQKSGNNNTYQQYNIIDGHINGQQSRMHDSTTATTVKQTTTQQTRRNEGNQRESSIGSGKNERTVERRDSSDLDVNSNIASNNMITNPKQRYYLGENPYAGSIFGKENRYEGARPQKIFNRRQKSEEPQQYHTRYVHSFYHNSYQCKS